MYIERNNNRKYGPVENRKIKKSYDQIYSILEKVKKKNDDIKAEVSSLKYDTNFNEEIGKNNIDRFFKNKI